MSTSSELSSARGSGIEGEEVETTESLPLSPFLIWYVGGDGGKKANCAAS
jgi:hypothetical protein